MFVYKPTIDARSLLRMSFKSQYQYFVRNTSISIKDNYPNIYIRIKSNIYNNAFYI